MPGCLYRLQPIIAHASRADVSCVIAEIHRRWCERVRWLGTHGLCSGSSPAASRFGTGGPSGSACMSGMPGRSRRLPGPGLTFVHFVTRVDGRKGRRVVELKLAAFRHTDMRARGGRDSILLYVFAPRLTESSHWFDRSGDINCLMQRRQRVVAVSPCHSGIGAARYDMSALLPKCWS